MYGSVLASCGYDRKVIIWKETNGSWDKLFEYSNHDSSGKQDLGHSVKEGTRVDQIIFQSFQWTRVDNIIDQSTSQQSNLLLVICKLQEDGGGRNYACIFMF